MGDSLIRKDYTSVICTLVSLLFINTTQKVQVITIGYILVFLCATQNQASCVKRQCI